MASARPYQELEWNIIAPGPSLKSWKVGDSVNPFKPRGPVIAVNNACLSGLPFDFLCAVDSPGGFKHIHEYFDLKQRNNIVVICRSRQAEAWLNLGYRVWPHQAREQDLVNRCWPVGSRPPEGIRYTSYSITTALLRAAGAGATLINFYGVDMAGDRYSYGPDTRKRAPKNWASRWKSEIPVFENAVNALENAGVKIIRHKPGAIN